MTSEEIDTMIEDAMIAIGIPRKDELWTLNIHATIGLFKSLSSLGMAGAHGLGTAKAVQVMRIVADCIEKSTSHQPLDDMAISEFMLMNTPTDEARH